MSRFNDWVNKWAETIDFFGVHPASQPIDNEAIRRAQEQHFLHHHPEFKPVLQGDYESQMNALGSLVADLRRRVAELESRMDKKVEDDVAF